MRIELAKLLLQKPDVLLLDEPTNHLDIESIQWLEDFLINNGKAVIVISHDRKFVDYITTRTIEVTMGRIYDYKVNYSKYLELRKERREQQQKAYDEQQKFIAETKEFIERFKGTYSKNCKCKAASRCWKSWCFWKWTKRTHRHCGSSSHPLRVPAIIRSSWRT